jgi:hypothetical protein
VLLSKDTGSTKSKKLWDNNAHPVSPASPEFDGDDKKKEDNTWRAFLYKYRWHLAGIGAFLLGIWIAYLVYCGYLFQEGVTT